VRAISSARFDTGSLTPPGVGSVLLPFASTTSMNDGSVPKSGLPSTWTRTSFPPARLPAMGAPCVNVRVSFPFFSVRFDEDTVTLADCFTRLWSTPARSRERSIA
jgi:hypothetical protein